MVLLQGARSWAMLYSNGTAWSWRVEQKIQHAAGHRAALEQDVEEAVIIATSEALHCLKGAGRPQAKQCRVGGAGSAARGGAEKDPLGCRGLEELSGGPVYLLVAAVSAGHTASILL